jgi:acyl-coenzyme A synthetase/AMP-(fatty) acid ligase
MSLSEARSLWSIMHATPEADRRLIGVQANVVLNDLACRSSLSVSPEQLRGASVLVATSDQLNTALALIELDGIARRIVLCPPDLAPEYLSAAGATAHVNALVSDGATSGPETRDGACTVTCSPMLRRVDCNRRVTCQTEWILITSGTTGMPKLVQHTLPSLTGAIKPDRHSQDSIVWSTFYDIRRYGGLQILLRTLLCGWPMVLSSAQDATEDFLIRAAANGVTHISGTPSHWRRALMSPAVHRLAPRYIRLSGEIVDQAILDSLRASYPDATIVHAFASTEAGVAFEVRDGRAGFPANLVGQQNAGVEIKVEESTLRIRSPRMAQRYLDDSNEALRCLDGFVDTHDLVELRGERYHFVGRRDGVINVGGLKVHPEEVEAVINGHPRVRMSIVKARRNSVTGALVVADVVEQSDVTPASDLAELRYQILEICRQVLAPYKVPALIRFVPSLQLRASGKLVRG